MECLTGDKLNVNLPADRMQKLALLYETTQKILSTFDLDEVLERILAVAKDYFRLPISAVWLRDPRGHDLYRRASSGWPEEVRPGRLPIGHGLVGCAAEVKRPIYAPNVQQDPRYVPSIPGIASQLAIPLIVADEVLGVLDCQCPVPDCLNREAIDLLTLFSTQASVALQNAQLHDLERRRARQLELINHIARQTTAVIELDDLLKSICDLLLKNFAAEHISVLLLDQNRLVLRAHYGALTPVLPGGAEISASAGLCGRALETGTPVVANDVLAERDYILGVLEARSELCLPLISFGHPLGVLVMSSSKLGAFQDSELQPLQSVADISAAAIQNAVYFDRMRQLAYRDGLTGTFNRRYFEMRVLQELERARRYGLVLSVMMIDLDGFKSLNDEFGHLLGDEALRQVATLLSQHMRKADIICRFGGDEFAVLLPETLGENAVFAAEKLRRAIESWDFSGVPRPLSLSVGIASYPEHGTSRDGLVKSADDALYLAKQSGKNRVCLASSEKTAGD